MLSPFAVSSVASRNISTSILVSQIKLSRLRVMESNSEAMEGRSSYTYVTNAEWNTSVRQ